jgi:hypothetical protein
MSVAAAAGLFAAFDRPWWIAGGVAIDLFVGRRTRDHGDLDVEVLARDQDRVRGVLEGWDLFVAHGGRLRPWEAGERLVPGRGSLWCRPSSAVGWALQVLIADADGDAWIFRRDPRIRLPLAEVVRRSAEGVPFLAPQVQLLFKAKAVRPVDQVDFDAAAPLLDPTAGAWLVEALALAHPGHPWSERVRPRPS